MEKVARFLSMYVERPGGCCSNKKNRGKKNVISMYIPVANSFTPERDFSDQISCRRYEFLADRDRVLP